MSSLQFRKELNHLQAFSAGKTAKEVKEAYQLQQVARLSANENPYGCSPTVREAVIKVLDEPSYYPDGNFTDLKNALCKMYPVKPEQLTFGCGGDELIANIGKALIDPGDECITAETTFGQYEVAVTSMGGTMVYVPMKDYGFDLDAIIDRITEKTKLIFLCNPNNPTGTVFNQEAQEKFIARVPKNIAIVIDEAYREFAFVDDFPDTFKAMRKHENVLVLKTFSKVYGLASFRVGYIAAWESVIQMLERVRNAFNVSRQAQAAALAALADQEFAHRAAENNKAVVDYLSWALEEMGIPYIPTNTSFIMVDIGKPSMPVQQKLMKQGYLVRPGRTYGMENWLRVSIGSMAQMEGFVEALKKAM